MTVDRQTVERAHDGECDLAYKCENAGRMCDECTRSWYYHDADDWFSEIDCEEPLTEDEEKSVKMKTAGDHPTQAKLAEDTP